MSALVVGIDEKDRFYLIVSEPETDTLKININFNIETAEKIRDRLTALLNQIKDKEHDKED